MPIAAWFQAAHKAGHMPPAAARPLAEAASGRAARSGCVGYWNRGNEAAPAGGGHVGPCFGRLGVFGPIWVVCRLIRVFSIGKYAFQKKTSGRARPSARDPAGRTRPGPRRCHSLAGWQPEWAIRVAVLRDLKDPGPRAGLPVARGLRHWQASGLAQRATSRDAGSGIGRGGPGAT